MVTWFLLHLSKYEFITYKYILNSIEVLFYAMFQFITTQSIVQRLDAFNVILSINYSLCNCIAVCGLQLCIWQKLSSSFWLTTNSPQCYDVRVYRNNNWENTEYYKHFLGGKPAGTWVDEKFIVKILVWHTSLMAVQRFNFAEYIQSFTPQKR